MFNCSSYGNDLDITKYEAKKGYHSGYCDNDIKELMLKPKIKKQLDKLNPNNLRRELKGYGVWSDKALSNHNDNLMRWLWLSCAAIVERIGG